MMIGIIFIMAMSFLSINISHLIADFFLQPRWIGESKSSSWYALFVHVFIYSGAVWVLVPLLVNLFGVDTSVKLPLMWTYWNSFYTFIYLFVGHFMVDVWTSRLTTKFYNKFLETKDKKWMSYFWSIIGIDQTLHIIHLGGYIFLLLLTMFM